MRILGIDPGLRVTGFGVIDHFGQHPLYVASGCIRTTREKTLSLRLKILVEGITSVIMQYQPTVAVVEKVFVNINPQSTLRLGEARGAIISTLVMANLILAEYTALQVKQAIVGKGHAKKAQVQHMIQYLLNLNGLPQADAADALACAVTYSHYQFNQITRQVTPEGLCLKQGRIQLAHY